MNTWNTWNFTTTSLYATKYILLIIKIQNPLMKNGLQNVTKSILMGRVVGEWSRKRGWWEGEEKWESEINHCCFRDEWLGAELLTLQNLGVQ